MYVNIFCSVRKSNLFSLFSILRNPLIFHFILLWTMKSSYKLLFEGGGHLNLDGGQPDFYQHFLLELRVYGVPAVWPIPWLYDMPAVLPILWVYHMSAV